MKNTPQGQRTCVPCGLGRFVKILCCCAITLTQQNCSSNVSTKGMNNVAQGGICIFTNINNNNAKLFTRRLQEYPFISSYPNCKYLLFANIIEGFSSVTTVTGTKTQVVVDMAVAYTVFLNDTDKQQQILHIINNPMITDFPFWTGAKNAYASRSTRSEATVKQQDSVGEQNVYNSTIAKIAGITSTVATGYEKGLSSFSTNPILLTAETLGTDDTLGQLATSMAEKTMNAVIIDINEYEDKIAKQKPKKMNNQKI